MNITDTYRHKSEATYLNPAQRRFIVYVRTLQFMKTRMRGIDEGEAVHINQKFIEQEFFKFDKSNPHTTRAYNLQYLVTSGELCITSAKSPTTGHEMKLYKALKGGGIDLHLYRELNKPEEANYGDNTIKMREYLKRVSLPGGVESTPYFDAFIQNREQYLELFFTVDDFARRVHTPVTNLHRHLRPYLLIDNCQTVGLDVKTMQPLLLGKVLTHYLGNNQYSQWINNGADIYVMLQTSSGLETRDKGKKRFFEIVFAPPNNELAGLFGRANWINWINEYKRKEQPGNPHTKNKTYSNLAWLLQTTEVMTMRKVWRELNAREIPFLSVHDEVIIKQANRHEAERIFRSILDNEFEYYQLNVKEPPQ